MKFSVATTVLATLFPLVVTGERNLKDIKDSWGGEPPCGGGQIVEANCGKFRFNAIYELDEDGNKDLDKPLNFCYPFTTDQNPMVPISAESLRTFDDYQVYQRDGGVCYEDITTNIFEAFPNMKNTHADDPDVGDRDQYWKEVRELIAFYYLRINGVKSKEIFDQVALVSPTPVNFVFDPEDTIDKSAGHVFGDFPTTHVTDFVTGKNSHPETAALIGNKGYKLFNLGPRDLDPFIFRNPACYSQNFIPFVNAEVALGFLLAWTIQTVSAVAFAAKWSGGRARPHEIVWEIYANDGKNLPYPVPKDIMRNIKKMNLSQDVDFTWGSRGSPGHPAHPAMHSAGSAISSWIQVVLDGDKLTEEKIEMSRRYDWSVATFRTFGGVHYISDNRAGLQLGRDILGINGPQFLGYTYGCDDESTAAIFEYANRKVPYVNWGTYFPAGWTNPVWLSNEKGYTDLTINW